MNNRPAPVSINTSQAYIKEVTRTRDTESQEVTVSMTTDEIITGFNMAVMPRILEHGRLILSMSIALSEKDSMETTSLKGIRLRFQR
jgi:type II secretory pathway component GspD/PulD (secretin)